MPNPKDTDAKKAVTEVFQTGHTAHLEDLKGVAPKVTKTLDEKTAVVNTQNKAAQQDAKAGLVMGLEAKSIGAKGGPAAELPTLSASVQDNVANRQTKQFLEANELKKGVKKDVKPTAPAPEQKNRGPGQR